MNEIRNFTNGYPYLVSRLCKNIDEYLDKDWTLGGLRKSIKMTLNEHNTLFDDVIKNIENYEEIKNIVNEILVSGKQIQYNPFVYEKGIMYGIFAEKEGKLVIHNKIFESLLYDYLFAQKESQEFMKKEYNEKDKNFLEENRILIFLAFIKF